MPRCTGFQQGSGGRSFEKSPSSPGRNRHSHPRLDDSRTKAFLHDLDDPTDAQWTRPRTCTDLQHSSSRCSTRGYCGTMSHDTEVVYQRYMGWYDRNPPNLHALPPVPVAKNYVEYMGGRGGEAGRVREPGQPGGEAAARGRARADGDARHLPRLAQHRDAVNASHEYRLMTRADSVISRA